MDLCELTGEYVTRHPWETVRAKVLQEILGKRGKSGEIDKVLDVGCGDGFTIVKVCQNLAPIKIDAIDINLTQEQIKYFTTKNSTIKFYSDFESLPHKNYTIITLFDVLEHVGNDSLFLHSIVKWFSTEHQSKIFITVPAFNWLFTSHDISLKHYRRYNQKTLHLLASQNGLKIIDYGYMFFGLLLVRLITLLYEKLTRNRKKHFRGVGQWYHGKILTKAIELVLYADCRLAFHLNRFGVKIPGLTLWCICKRLR